MTVAGRPDAHAGGARKQPSAAGTMRLYSELAAWWPLLDDPADYAEEAGVYGDLLAEACDAPIESLLELGSGGGNTASHLKQHFRRLVLTDLSEDMLAVSRALNPECEHRVGDMRTLRLGRTFDAVFVHDAVCYMTTEADLRGAIETAWVHCRPGGAVLFAPDYVRENFRAGETTGGCDERPLSGVCRRVPAGPALPGVGLGSRSAGYGVPGRLRVPAARARRIRPRRAGPARRGAVRARPLARSAGERRVRSSAACRSSCPTWNRAGTRCSQGAGRADQRHRTARRDDRGGSPERTDDRDAARFASKFHAAFPLTVYVTGLYAVP